MKKRNDGRVRKEYIRRDLVALLGREEEDVVRISEEERPFKRLTKRIVRGKKKKRETYLVFGILGWELRGGKIEPRRLGGGKKNCNGGTKIC